MPESPTSGPTQAPATDKGSAALGCGTILLMFLAIALVVYLAARRWPGPTVTTVCVLSSVLAFASIVRRRRSRRDWSRPILRDVWIELIKALPPDWTAATLELNAPSQGLGSGVTHAISSPDQKRDVVFPTDALLEATRKLELESVKRNDRWRRVLVRVSREGKDWQSGADFDYGPPAQEGEFVQRITPNTPE